MQVVGIIIQEMKEYMESVEQAVASQIYSNLICAINKNLDGIKIGENVNIATITNKCNGYTNSCYSEYTYSYEELTSEQIKNKFLNKHYKKINMYDLDDNYVCTFNSLKDGGDFIGRKNAAALISNCCTGRKKTAYGYKWYYTNNLNQPDKTKIID